MTLRQSPASSSKPVAAVFGILLALWTGAASAQSTNQEVKVPDWVALEANLPYDTHPQTVLDILRPKAASAGQRPGVIMFHGGSWLRTTKESMMGSFCLPYLKHDFVVCNVEYRLSPVAKAPAAVNDALQAARWFFDHAAQYNVDTNRIVITGASAGSHLALMAGMATIAANLGPTTRPAAIVNCYGVTEVADLLSGPHRKSWAIEWLPEQDGQMELARRVSPLTYARKGLPPVFTAHGGSDTTVPAEHAFKLTEALRSAGAETELLVVTNARHGFTREEWPAVHERIFKFLEERGIAPNPPGSARGPRAESGGPPDSLPKNTLPAQSIPQDQKVTGQVSENPEGFGGPPKPTRQRHVLPTASSADAPAGFSLADPPRPDDFVLFDGRDAVALFLETNDSPSVIRAAGDLADDFARVSGVKAPVIHDPPVRKTLVIIGTLGLSRTIDSLAASGRLDTNGIRGQWESWVLQTVKQPLPGVDRALVIAGSDRRGTIYGIYELSELIGVSPWHWWADVPVKQRKQLALRGSLKKQGPPAVKFRGIFLNDEDWGLRPWAAQTFEPEVGHIGPKTYAKIFELLLRLRSNYLWPAMHEGTPAFNSFPTNKHVADLYGIVMGSSHCEQMLRDNVDEWKRDGTGGYNYVTNRDGVLKYWEQRVRENGRFDNVFTMGMRGIHDSGMPGGGTPREQAERLHQIIGDQRDLLRRWVNPNVAAVPQIFCPYKEVLELYRLAPDLPEDITLVWPDDNHSYVRQFSDARERQRSGGAGVYYHISYWGRPQDYLWLCSTPPALIAEEMCKAYDYGANRLWVLNVGDIKPAEIATEFFLNLAWNPRAWTPANANELLEERLARDFGPEHAKEIAGILAEYYRLNFQRKPEHMNFATNASPHFSTMLNGDEAARRLEAWQALVERADAAGKKLPAEFQNAYFEMVGYPVRGAALMNGKWLALTQFTAGQKQGRTSAHGLLAKARRAHEEIQRETERYNNLAGGKWRQMMSASPRKQSVFAAPPDMPAPKIPFAPAKLGIAVEGNGQAWFARSADSPVRESPTNATQRPADPAVRAPEPETGVPLPQFNKLTQRSYFVDVFNAGTQPLRWIAAPDADWIQLSRKEGEGDARISVSIDWSRMPAGEDVKGKIKFAGSDVAQAFQPAGSGDFPVPSRSTDKNTGLESPVNPQTGMSALQELSVEVSVFNPADISPAGGADFVEDNRRVVMEAGHASAFVPGKDAKWEIIRGLGYNGEAVSVFPATVAVRNEAEQIRRESPALQYRMWLRTPGDWKITVRALPTFSVETGQPQRYAIALDDQPPRIVSLPAATSERDRVWGENVLRNAALTASNHSVEQPGLHTLKVWMVDPGIVIDAIAAGNGGDQELGYTWPAETRIRR